MLYGELLSIPNVVIPTHCVVQTSSRDETGIPICCRRAKRLKRIERQLNSSAATAAASRFGRHGLVVLFVLLLAHVICYGVLDGTLKGRSM